MVPVLAHLPLVMVESLVQHLTAERLVVEVVEVGAVITSEQEFRAEVAEMVAPDPTGSSLEVLTLLSQQKLSAGSGQSITSFSSAQITLPTTVFNNGNFAGSNALVVPIISAGVYAIGASVNTTGGTTVIELRKNGIAIENQNVSGFSGGSAAFSVILNLGVGDTMTLFCDNSSGGGTITITGATLTGSRFGNIPNQGGIGGSGSAGVVTSNGGNASAPSAISGGFGYMLDYDAPLVYSERIKPGASGGGGAAGGGGFVSSFVVGSPGGAGGAGGNVVIVEVTGNIVIGPDANAGVSTSGLNGTNGTNGTSQGAGAGGGGGGGGGGALLVAYIGAGSNVGTTAGANVNAKLTSSAGSGGSGGTGSAGVTGAGGAGSNGEVGFLRVIKVA